MTEFFSEYGLFLAKTITFMIAVMFIMAVVVSNALRSKRELEKGTLTVTHLNKDMDDLRETIKKHVMDRHLLKLEFKRDKKKSKQDKKNRKKKAKSGEPDEGGKRVYVIDFEGDIKASQVENLRKVITAVLAVARPKEDEILLRLESPGGMVHGYGLAASQLNRIRQQGIPLTICVDKVAASGGYMMACLGNRIVSAPFAYVGSIGVLMQLPNFHRFLEEKKIDYEMITAGEYKRTLTLFGENTEKGREKAKEEIEEAHRLFKDFVSEYRPSLDIDAVATGETWFGSKAVDKGLVDAIKTSDECIVEACEHADVYAVSYEHKKKLSERLGRTVEKALDNGFLNWVQRTGSNRFF